MAERLKIAVLFGGCSEEHDVSVKSAIEVAASIDTGAYEPIYIGITKAGVWKTCARPHAAWERGAGPRAVISPDRGAHGLLITEHGRWHTIPIDVVFPVLHGKFGEDGAVQGLLELSGLPYVGCGIASSAICMDKSLTYVVAKSAGIATPAFAVLDGDNATAPKELRAPVFVKPARSGSSFGVTRVDRGDELEAAIATAKKFDHKVLVEEAIVGSEVGCAVLGRGADAFVGEVDHIQLSGGFFRIHQQTQPELGSENATITVPAELPDEQREQVRQTAASVYAALGCEGLARVDMFLQPDGRIVLNEVNTLPGFTAYSRYPRMMAAAGLSRSDVITRLIASALER